MKRTFDNSMAGGQSTSGQISAGVVPTKDIVYFNTNMINIQREDHTNAHGIASSFNQTRVLPIVGRTNRAEVAIKSVDIQTKTLPIFQPQVQLGANVNRLIYEVGLSSTWRNTLISLPPDGSTIDTLSDAAVLGTAIVDPINSYYGESTFLNIDDSNAECRLIDAFNISTLLTLIPVPTLSNTVLSVLFDYWTRKTPSLPPSLFYSTCLTPLVVPSVQQRIIATSYLNSGVDIGKLVVEVSSVSGFQTGDRVRLFGITYAPVSSTVSTEAVPVDLFATVLDVVQYDAQPSSFATGTHPSLVLDYPWQTAQANSYIFSSSASNGYDTLTFFLTFGSDTNKFIVGQTVLITGDPLNLDTRINNAFLTVTSISMGMSITCSINITGTSPMFTFGAMTITSLREFSTGYVINEVVRSGGHIEFLTDESEFIPLKLNGRDQTASGYTGTIILTYDASFNLPLIENRGFYRGFNSSLGTDFPMTSAVELTCLNGTSIDATLYNGVYQILKRTTTTIELLPLSKALPFAVINILGVNFSLKLAPNFYSLDTTADEIAQVPATSKKYNFIRSLGFLLTDNVVVKTATYPPTATVPSQTWTRAYTVNWDFSAYRNVNWVAQDTTASIPGLPLLQQDFGVDSSSTYYNVYEVNKFFADCVNKTLERCINDQEYEILNLEAISLNGQLATVFMSYSQLFETPAVNFLWNPLSTYNIGSLVVSGTSSSSFVFISTKPGVTQSIPLTPTSSPSWMFLGYVPYQTGDTTPFALCIRKNIAAGGTFTITSRVENGTPGRVYTDISLYSLPGISYPAGVANVPITTLIPLPSFTTIAPQFHYDNLTLLSHCRFDGTGFGTTNVLQQGLQQSTIALYNYERRSWGKQGSQNADEWFALESNSSFKFLLDNFPSYCIGYADTLAELRSGETYPQIEYWVWDNSSTTVDPRVGTGYYEISQTSESLSSCMSPVQSIVVVSENIPVVDELSSPAYYLIDSDSSSFASQSQTISLTEKIIGEIFLPTNAPYNSRSVIHYEEDNFKFVSLLDTRLFKQLEYSVYYRHRITQQLVPLILSNYGNINIKFVFRPIS